MSYTVAIKKQDSDKVSVYYGNYVGSLREILSYVKSVNWEMFEGDFIDHYENQSEYLALFCRGDYDFFHDGENWHVILEDMAFIA